MIYITPQSLITQQSVSHEAAVDKLRGTPLEPWTDYFIQMSNQYNIDLNWVLSYMQWETGFGTAGPNGRHPSMDFNDPWDMLCGTPTSGPGSAVEGATCVQAPNGYWYDAFPTMEAGIEAGYKNWARYVANGWTDWFTSLSVALCGVPTGCEGTTWVQSVISQGQYNARQWPYVPGEEPPTPIPPETPPIGTQGSQVNPAVFLLGAGFLVGAAYTVYRVTQGSG